MRFYIVLNFYVFLAIETQLKDCQQLIEQYQKVIKEKEEALTEKQQEKVKIFYYWKYIGVKLFVVVITNNVFWLLQSNIIIFRFCCEIFESSLSFFGHIVKLSVMIDVGENPYTFIDMLQSTGQIENKSPFCNKIITMKEMIFAVFHKYCTIWRGKK